MRQAPVPSLPAESCSWCCCCRTHTLAHLCWPCVRLLEASTLHLCLQLLVLWVDAGTGGIEEPARKQRQQQQTGCTEGGTATTRGQRQLARVAGRWLHATSQQSVGADSQVRSIQRLGWREHHTHHPERMHITLAPPQPPRTPATPSLPPHRVMPFCLAASIML